MAELKVIGGLRAYLLSRKMYQLISLDRLAAPQSPSGPGQLAKTFKLRILTWPGLHASVKEE